MLSGRIDNLDFRSSAKEAFGNGILYPFTTNSLHLRLFFANVLKIDRRCDRDVAGQQLFDILPALVVFAARRICISKPIDQA